MPAARAVTPEPVTNSGRGLGGGGRRGQGSSGEHLMGAARAICRPLHSLYWLQLERGRGFWLEPEEEACC